MAKPGLERLRAGLNWNRPTEHLQMASLCGLALHHKVTRFHGGENPEGVSQEPASQEN